MRKLLNKFTAPKIQLALCIAWLVGAQIVISIAQETFVIGGGSPERLAAAREAASTAVAVAAVHGFLSLILFLTKLWWIAALAVAVPAIGVFLQTSSDKMSIDLLAIYVIGIIIVALAMISTLVVFSVRQNKRNESLQ